MNHGWVARASSPEPAVHVDKMRQTVQRRRAACYFMRTRTNTSQLRALTLLGIRIGSELGTSVALSSLGFIRGSSEC